MIKFVDKLHSAKNRLHCKIEIKENEQFLENLAEVMSIGMSEDSFVYYDEKINKIIGIWETIILLSKGMITPSLILMISEFLPSKLKNMKTKDDYGQNFNKKYKEFRWFFGFTIWDFELFFDGFWDHSLFEEEKCFNDIKFLAKLMMLIHGIPSNFNTSVMEWYYEEYKNYFKQEFGTQFDVAMAFHRFTSFNKDDLKIALNMEEDSLKRKDEIKSNKMEHFDAFLRK
jgi:hypothetical protein